MAPVIPILLVALAVSCVWNAIAGFWILRLADVLREADARLRAATAAAQGPVSITWKVAGQVTGDSRVGALYVDLQDVDTAFTRSCPDALVDFAADGTIVGVELVGLGRVVHRQGGAA